MWRAFQNFFPILADVTLNGSTYPENQIYQIFALSTKGLEQVEFL